MSLVSKTSSWGGKRKYINTDKSRYLASRWTPLEKVKLCMVASMLANFTPIDSRAAG